MSTEPEKTKSEPCHTQLWNELGRLDDTVDEMGRLYEKLTGTEPQAVCDPEMADPPHFGRVLSEASMRVSNARESIDKLRLDFEKLCLCGN